MRKNSKTRYCIGIVATLLFVLSLLAANAQETTSVLTSMPKDNAVQLHAGPLHCKFVDGELRYLYAGDKEVARRIYFAVRDDQWNTALPQFSKMEVSQTENGFIIHLAATCHSDKVGYQWQGRIEGTPDGKITFHATGVANRDMGSNRIGICLLYGIPSLVGQAFQTTETNGKSVSGTFPALVSSTLVGSKFRTLRYTTKMGMVVTANMVGTQFDMEDQRNWGDTSYKAYAPLAYAYPRIKKGDVKAQTLTFHVDKVPHVNPPTTRAVFLQLGALQPEARIPKQVPLTPNTPDSVFWDLNGSREKVGHTKMLTWGLAPSVHLPDNDNFMDNTRTIVDQAKTARLFAPGAKLHIEPIYLRKGHDPRNGTMFEAAWTAVLMKYLAQAQVEEAAFAMKDGFTEGVLEQMRYYTGASLYVVKITGTGPVPVEAFAIDADGKPICWLINVTNQSQVIHWTNLAPNTTYQTHFTSEANSAAPLAQGTITTDIKGTLSRGLPPYGILLFQPQK